MIVGTRPVSWEKRFCDGFGRLRLAGIVHTIAILLVRKTNNTWVKPWLDIFDVLLKIAKITKSSVSPYEPPNPAKMFQSILNQDTCQSNCVITPTTTR